MDEPLKVIIRKLESSDRDQVRSISYDTMLMGEPASFLLNEKEIVCDALTSYFVGYEPESSFVAEVDSKVVGYLLGTKNKLNAERVFNSKILPGLFFKAIKGGFFLKKKNIVFILGCFRDMLSGNFKAPDFISGYPASMHINIKESFRGRNIGSQLMSAYLDFLKKEGILGVHLATMSDRAATFFSKQGFKLLHKGKRTYFRSVLNKDVPLYIYGIKLSS